MKDLKPIMLYTLQSHFIGYMVYSFGKKTVYNNITLSVDPNIDHHPVSEILEHLTTETTEETTEIYKGFFRWSHHFMVVSKMKSKTALSH